MLLPYLAVIFIPMILGIVSYYVLLGVVKDINAHFESDDEDFEDMLNDLKK
jgi:hypothetical protein